MNYWYLVASLPALALGSEPPLTPAAFRVQCGEHLLADDLRELDLVLQGSAQAGSYLAREWLRLSTMIADELAVLRGARLDVDPTPWRVDVGVPDAGLATAVREAMQQPDARSRELQLDALRWRLLEDLARAAPFGLAAVLTYGLRLQILARWAARTETAGRERLGQHLDALLAAFDRTEERK